MKTQNYSYTRVRAFSKISRLGLIGMLTLGMTAFSHAQSTNSPYWVGGGSDNKWSNSGNWSNADGGASGYLPTNGTSAVASFKNAAIIDVDQNWGIRRLVFDNTSGSVILGGTGKLDLRLQRGNTYWINTDNAGNRTITTDLTFSYLNNEANMVGHIGSSGGVLTLGNVFVTQVSGSTSPSMTLTLRGTSTGANTIGSVRFDEDTTPASRILRKIDLGKWTVAGTNNNFTEVQLNGSELKFATAAALSASARMVFDVGSNYPTLHLNNQALVAERVVVNGASGITNGIARIIDDPANTNGSLTATNGITVNGAWFLVNGRVHSNAAVEVGTDAILAGTSTLSASAGSTITMRGTLSPGSVTNYTHTNKNSDIGTLTFSLSGAGKLKFEADSTVIMQLGATTAASDQIAFATAGDWLDGSGKAILDLSSGSINYSLVYTIFHNVTTSGFAFADITGYDNATYSALFQRVGNDYQLSFVTGSIPEPAAAAIIGAIVALLFAGVAIRRRASHVSR